MQGYTITLWVLFVLCGFQSCMSSNILVLSTIPSPSHSLWCNKLAEILVKRGHTVTILDTDPPRMKLENLTSYTMEGGYAATDDLDYLEMSSEKSPIYSMSLFYNLGPEMCKTLFYSPTFKRFVQEHVHKEKPFDMIIHDITLCECFLGLVPLLGNPKLVLVTAFGENQALHVMESQGHMIHSPWHLSPFTHPMSFVEKLKNLYYYLYNYYAYHNSVNVLDGYSKEMFGESTPHVQDIAKSAAVALVNAHPILDGAKYYSPAIIHVPGFHIDEPKKLNEEIQTFLDGATHGAIYFSLGTNIKSSLMSEDRINIFLNVFKKLKQRVLWKFENKNLKTLPGNVKISKWFSQNDILAHPNVKLFITHNGLLSTQEAIYHGVPLVSMPFISDQHFLTAKLEREGLTVPLSYAGLTENILQQAIEEVLTNSSYTTKMKKWSKLFKDRPIKPKELAAFWIESVLRNDDYKYLQPPEHSLSKLELILFDLKTILGIFLGFLIAFLAICCKAKPQKKLKRQ